MLSSDSPSQGYKKEIIHLVKLSSPVLIASIAQNSMNIVDTIMAGGVSPTDMAAVAVAGSIWWPTILFGIGLITAMVSVISKLNGAKHFNMISFNVHQIVYVALIVSVPLIMILLQINFIVSFMDIEPSLAQKTIDYVYAIILAVPATLLFQSLRAFTDGMSLTKPAMVIGFIGLLLNIPFNWIFVYGKFGAPALGGVGCGVATSIVYWLMFLMLVVYVKFAHKLQHINVLANFSKPDLNTIGYFFKLGIPAASALFFEVSLFTIVALLIAPFGAIIVASHQVAANLSSLVFMIPLSIGAAATIRVGHKLGEQDVSGARTSSLSAIFIGIIATLAVIIITLLFKKKLISLYTDNMDIINLGAQLLLFAAIYQIFDAIQVISSGALRGYKDMKAILYITLFSYWGTGFPVGYILGKTDLVVKSLGVHGFWIGFIVGLATAALLLIARLLWLHKQDPQKQLSVM